MVEESEKMMALKKAYAEIILNTAKEAAARMMVSERKVHQLNQDLSSTKDEALRLLLRLKQTMDFKLNEAEMKSLNQQRRIEELEAQLQEAEDIVGNLRVELNDAHMKLEEMGKNQTHSKPNMMDMAASVEEMTEPKKAPAEANLSSQAKGLASAANGHCMANNYSKDFGYVGVSEVGFGYVGVPEVPSIILRSKEPELYRNGCTQRIRAYEGNLLNGHFSLPGDLDALKNEKTNLREDKEGERIHIKEVKKVDTNSCNGQAIKSFRKKRKRGARYGRRIVSVPKPDPSVTKETISDLSDSQTCLGSHDHIESLNDENKGTHSLSPSRVPSNVKENGALSKQGDHEFPEAHTHDVDEDREVASSLVLIRQQSDTGDCLDVPSLNPETEIKNVTSVNTDAKVLDIGEGFPSPPPKDRVLKYTFQRKRKKESLSDDSSLSHQENPLKRKIGKKLNGSLELLKSATVAESSRDNRRMAQVARQLISLSEKKWWK